jgi:hypothetical protein
VPDAGRAVPDLGSLGQPGQGLAFAYRSGHVEGQGEDRNTEPGEVTQVGDPECDERGCEEPLRGGPALNLRHLGILRAGTAVVMDAGTHDVKVFPVPGYRQRSTGAG